MSCVWVQPKSIPNKVSANVCKHTLSTFPEPYPNPDLNNFNLDLKTITLDLLIKYIFSCSIWSKCKDTHRRMLLDALVDVYLETATGNGKLMDRIKINLPTQSTRWLSIPPVHVTVPSRTVPQRWDFYFLFCNPEEGNSPSYAHFQLISWQFLTIKWAFCIICNFSQQIFLSC